MYGCRVVQKAIEVAEPEQRRLMASELKDRIRELVEDQNGNHVIQKIIETMGKEEPIMHSIIDAFQRDCFILAQHAYGCRVIQRMLEYCDHALIEPVIQTILPELERLTELSLIHI